MFFPMRSEGFPFISGGLGVETVFASSCSRVRNCPQPSATVRGSVFLMDRQVLFRWRCAGIVASQSSMCRFAAQAQCFGRLRVLVAVPVGFAIQVGGSNRSRCGAVHILSMRSNPSAHLGWVKSLLLWRGARSEHVGCVESLSLWRGAHFERAK